MLDKIKTRKSISILLVIIALLYITFLYMDIFHGELFMISNLLKLISVILCFSLSLLVRNQGLGIKDLTLLRLGLFITIIGDLFLLVLNSHYILGIFLFSLVQTIYIVRYDIQNIWENIKRSLIILFSLILIYGILNYGVREIDFLIIISLYYFITLLTSLMKSIRAYKLKLYPNPNRFMIVLAMFLFLLCDLNVGLYNITKTTSFLPQYGSLLSNISSILIWLFYLPSQVLLSLSGYRFS